MPPATHLRFHFLPIKTSHFRKQIPSNPHPRRYDSCFLKWYSEKYLRGTAKSDECEPLFREYKTCLSVSHAFFLCLRTASDWVLQKALKERGIDTMLEEARADNRENDAEYLKPSKGS